MLKFSDVIKTFIRKFYVLLAIFALVFSISSIQNAIENRPSLLDRGTYVSQSELYVSSSSIVNSDTLTNYMNRIVPRVKTPKFLDIVKDKIAVGINEGGEFFEFSEEHKDILNKLTTKDLENSIRVTVEPNTTVFQISYSNNVAVVAQAVNKIVTNEIFTTLSSGDKNNILGGSSDNSLKYSIGREASLPTSLTSNHVAGNTSLSLFKVILISIALYIFAVIVYDFAMGYINSYQKAKCMVNAEIISEIEIPYEKSPNGAKSNGELPYVDSEKTEEGK